MRNSKYTKLLQDVSKNDISRAGGKAANLGEMIKAGLPVPEGFVLLVSSYKNFIIANNINIAIKGLLQALDYDDHQMLDETSEKIRRLIEQGEIPGDILGEIDRAYEQLGSPEVAVRSSATAEDLPGTSFAGQHDTFLNVKGKEQLYRCVKKCWASFWNTRALLYRLKQGIDNTGLAHGVVVQKLIGAEKSGILFTANPINGRRDQMLLNASWGFGEAIVGGEVAPDQWVVDKKNHQVVQEKIATKEIMTVRKEAGTEIADVPEELREQPTLDREEVLKLLELGEQAEAHSGGSQDLEWVSSESHLYLVQSRPVTTLYPMLKPEDTGQELRIYANFLLSKQATHEPLTPMGEDVWKKAIMNIIFNRKSSKMPAGWLKSAGGRLFIDVTELHRFERWWDKLKENPTDMDPVTTKTIVEVLERNKVELTKQKKSLLIPGLRMLFKLNPRLLMFMLTSLPKVLYGAAFPAEKVVAKAYKHGRNHISFIKQKREGLQTREEKLKFIEQHIPTCFYFAPLEIAYFMSASFTYIERARKLMSKYLDDTSLLDKVEKAVPHCVTTEMGIELLQIAKKLDQAGEQPAPDHPEIKQFLDRYGHRSCQEVDLGAPRWKEDPGYVISLIESYMDHKSYYDGIENFYRDMEEAERAIEKITTQLKDKGARRDAWKVAKLLNKFRNVFGVRELPKYILTEAVSLFRETLMEIGAELQAEGRLGHKLDVFFVSLEDIKSGGKLQELVSQNREEYRKELQRNPVPRVITSTGETIYSSVEDKSDGAYRGIPVSSGVGEGPVKVLNHPAEGNRLKQGDILVTTATNPGWTPLFLKISGLVMETGGPISHGSVVAREYGIPAVAGVTKATTRLKEGQIVRLNGETGSVEIISP